MELPPESAGVRAVFAQLQVALHTLVAALLVLTLVSAHRDSTGEPDLPAVAAAVGFAAVYVAGTVWDRRRATTRAVRLGWLAAVLALWAALVVQVPEAAYLVFPLFFVALYQAFRLLGNIGTNRAFSRASITSLRTIRFCALGLVGLVVAAEILLILSSGSDDRAGGVAIGAVLAFGALAAAAAATLFEGILRQAVTRIGFDPSA